jgi:uncharacterized protein YjiS (DUF1127 family)
LVRINPPTSARRIVDRMLAGAGAVLRAALAGHRRRKTEQALSTLSDAALKDIGIHRAEIRTIADALMEGGTAKRRTEH